MPSLKLRCLDGARWEHATAKDAAIELLDIMTPCAHSGNGKWDLVPDSERHRNAPSLSRSISHHIASDGFVTQ
jgi:hypothetical protein